MRGRDGSIPAPESLAVRTQLNRKFLSGFRRREVAAQVFECPRSVGLISKFSAFVLLRASAGSSTARGRDEFVVRERYADEAPRVVVLCDRRPSMALYPPPFRWLSKPDVVRSASELIVASAEAEHAAVAYLDYAGCDERGGEPYWLAPTGRATWQSIETRQAGASRYDAPDDGIAQGLDYLARFRSKLQSGTFVFVISDFLGTPIPESVWLTASARRWEVVPVVVQDRPGSRAFHSSTRSCSPSPIRGASSSFRFGCRAATRAAGGRRTGGVATNCSRASPHTGSTRCCSRRRAAPQPSIGHSSTGRLDDAICAAADERAVWSHRRRPGPRRRRGDDRDHRDGPRLVEWDIARRCTRPPAGGPDIARSEPGILRRRDRRGNRRQPRHERRRRGQRAPRGGFCPLPPDGSAARQTKPTSAGRRR